MKEASRIVLAPIALAVVVALSGCSTGSIGSNGATSGGGGSSAGSSGGGGGGGGSASGGGGSGGGGGATGDDGSDPGDDGGTAIVNPVAAACAAPAIVYKGLGGEDLSTSPLFTPTARAQEVAGSDRLRFKAAMLPGPTAIMPADPSLPAGPYTTTLRTEIERVMGLADSEFTNSTPIPTASIDSSLGSIPSHWYIEPDPNALATFDAYTVMFQACTLYVAANANVFTSPIATTNATGVCTTLQHLAWNRSPSDDETAACVQLAVTDSASEPTDARRWAYTCASVFSAADFLTY